MPANDALVQVVADRGDREAPQQVRRLPAEQSHQLLHFAMPSEPSICNVMETLGMNTVLPEEIVQLLVHRLARRLESGGQFGHQQAGHGPVLVAGILADQISVRFFAAQHELVGTLLVDGTRRST